MRLSFHPQIVGPSMAEPAPTGIPQETAAGRQDPADDEIELKSRLPPDRGRRRGTDEHQRYERHC